MTKDVFRQEAASIANTAWNVSLPFHQSQNDINNGIDILLHVDNSPQHQLESRGAHLSAGGGRGGAGLLDGGLVAGGDGGWREVGDEGERSEGWWQVAGAGEVGGGGKGIVVL